MEYSRKSEARSTSGHNRRAEVSQQVSLPMGGAVANARRIGCCAQTSCGPGNATPIFGEAMKYASYTRNTSEPLKRIAHKRRFAQVVELIAAPLETDTVLDYGCGDGHLFSYFVGRIPREKLVGYDPDPKLLAEASPDIVAGARLTGDIDALKLEKPFGFSLIYCMEVCEHLTTKAMAELFLNIRAMTAVHGRIVIGVPIETGPSGFFKNLYRVSKRMGYPASVLNAFRSLVGAPIERMTTDVEWFGHHTGFRHTDFRRMLEDSGFRIHRTHHLPFPVLGGVFNNEIYFVCTKT